MGACIHVGGSPCRGLQSTSAKTTHCPHFIQFARLPSEQTCRPMCTLLHHTMSSPRVKHLALYWLHIPVSVCRPTRVPAIPRQRGVMIAHHADAANHTPACPCLARTRRKNHLLRAQLIPGPATVKKQQAARPYRAHCWPTSETTLLQNEDCIDIMAVMLGAWCNMPRHVKVGATARVDTGSATGLQQDSYILFNHHTQFALSSPLNTTGRFLNRLIDRPGLQMHLPRLPTSMMPC